LRSVAGTSGRLKFEDVNDPDHAVPAARLELRCQATVGDQLVHELPGDTEQLSRLPGG